jgi:hypothetical protein
MANPWFLSSMPVLDQLGATMGSGVSGADTDYTALIQNQIEQQQRQADRDYGLRKQGLDQQYALAKMSARSQQERNQIDREYQQAQVELARDRLTQDARQFDENLGQRKLEFGQTLGENQRQFDIGQGNNVRDFGQRQNEFNTTTGLGLVNTLAQYSQHPASYWQAAEYARNVGQMPGTATFLGALQNNSRLAGFGAQAGVPDRESYATLASKLTGGGAGAGGAGGADPYDARLAQIKSIYAAGAHQLAPGSLEQLTPTERSLFTSGISAAGGDADTFLDQYRRSRIGQGVSNLRAA